MEKEKLESMLIDYIDGKLEEADRNVVEAELTRDAHARKLYAQLKEMMQVMEHTSSLTPSKELHVSFEQLLAKEIRQNRKTKISIFQPAFYRVAAAILLLVMAGSIGYFISQQQKQNAGLLAMQNELARTRELVLDKLNNEQSATQRIVGVKAAYQTEKPGDAIVYALIERMNEDENINVRLAAVEALGKFHHEPHVRQALIDALSTQTDPLVQMALIQLMVVMKVKEAVKPMEDMINNEQNLPVVKDEAHVGIFRLS